MAKGAETLVRLRGARKIYLRSIKNIERDIENFSIDDENSTIKLTSPKVFLQDRINKVKQQDEEILKILKTEDMENELEQTLIREEHFQILITRIERCLSKPKIHVDRNSLPSSNSSPLPVNKSVKVKLPKLEISKFNDDVINRQGFWDQFCSAIHENNSISNTDKFSYLKTFLCDSAIATISGLSLSAANYIPAIKLLKGR